MDYKAYDLTHAWIETSDGKRIELNTKNITIAQSDEEIQDVGHSVFLELHKTWSFSCTRVIPRHIRVGPFLMPFPPPDRMN